MGRIFLPFYLVIVAISVIGVYISNANLVLVANFSVASIIGMLLSIKVVDLYLVGQDHVCVQAVEALSFRLWVI